MFASPLQGEGRRFEPLSAHQRLTGQRLACATHLNRPENLVANAATDDGLARSIAQRAGRSTGGTRNGAAALAAADRRDGSENGTTST